MGLKQGDTVTILRQDNSSLQIVPALKRITKEQKDATIEVTKDNNPYFIARKLIALYFLGYNVIHIVPKDGRLQVEQREVIKNIARRILMGTEIIADSATGITLQVLINLMDLSVDAAFKRMLLIAKSMYRDVMMALRENNIELAEEVVKSDDEVDRFSFYIVRQLKIAIRNDHLLKEIGLVEPRNCLGYRLIAKSVERVADHAAIIAKDIIEMSQSTATVIVADHGDNKAKNDNSSKGKDKDGHHQHSTGKLDERQKEDEGKDGVQVIDKINEMCDFALEVLDDACLSMFKRDYEAADKAIEKARKVDQMERSIMNFISSNPKDPGEMYRIKLITENIRRVSEYASDIAEIVLNMTVQQTIRKS